VRYLLDDEAADMLNQYSNDPHIKEPKHIGTHMTAKKLEKNKKR
jgi:hypothetical protein